MPSVDSSLVSVVLIILLAAFVQGLSGFGSGLVAMALLPPLLGIRGAAPLVALVGGTVEVAMLIRYRNHLAFGAVKRLMAGAVLGIPLGILFLRNLDDRLTLRLLGVILVAYGAYSLCNLRLPAIRAAWAYGFGFVAGLLGGAYNTSGPPVVIYGDCQEWTPPEFKGNLQGFFLLNDVLVISGHALSGNFAVPVLQNYILTLPALLFGLLAGFGADRLIKPELFRRIVLGLLIILGARLLTG